MLEELRRELGNKTLDIMVFVAERDGLDDPYTMDSADYQRLATYVEELTEQYDELHHDMSGGDIDQYCDAAAEKFGRELTLLLLDRLRVEEQVLDLQDYEIADGKSVA